MIRLQKPSYVDALIWLLLWAALAGAVLAATLIYWALTHAAPLG